MGRKLNIASFDTYGRSDWDSSYPIWPNTGSNLRYSDSLLDDIQKVSFSTYGVSFPETFRWIQTKSVYAENYPSNNDTGKYLYRVKMLEDSKEVITNFPWWWSSSCDLDNNYLIKLNDSEMSLAVTVSGSGYLYFIEGTDFGVDTVFSDMDFVSFDLYTTSAADLSLSSLIVGDYFGNRYREWDLSSISLVDGWNNIKLKWKEADLQIFPHGGDQDIESFRYNNYRDLVLKSFRLTFESIVEQTFYLDGLRIQRNRFEENVKFGKGFYLANNEYLNFPLAEFDPHKGTIEFWLKPDFNFNSVDDFFETFSRTFFAFTNVSNDIVGFFMLRGSGPAIAVGDSNYVNTFYIKYNKDFYFTIGDVVHLAFVWSNTGTEIDSYGTTAAIYVNGVLAGSTNQQWDIHDTMSTRLIIGGSISQRASRDYPSSLWGVIDNLKVYNYCKTNFDLVNEVTADDVYSPNDLIEISKDGVHFYSKHDEEVPLRFDNVKDGDTVHFYIRSKIPRFLTKNVLRTASLLLEWIRSF